MKAARSAALEDLSFCQLTSARLVLRRLVSDDAGTIAAYRSDPEVARYQDWDHPYMLSQAKNLIAGSRTLAPGTPGAWFQFGVTLAGSGTLVGDIGLRTRKTDGAEAELGFTFATAHHGHGYATEAVGAVVRYAFETLAMQRVFARTDARNIRAQRLLDRLRFQRNPGSDKRSWFKGGWTTDFFYEQLASDAPRDLA